MKKVKIGKGVKQKPGVPISGTGKNWYKGAIAKVTAEQTIEAMGKDLIKTCRKLLRNLRKFYYKELREDGKLQNKLRYTRFMFYRGKLMAYLYILHQLAINEKDVDLIEEYSEIQVGFARAEKQVEKFILISFGATTKKKLEEMIRNKNVSPR